MRTKERTQMSFIVAAGASLNLLVYIKPSNVALKVKTYLYSSSYLGRLATADVVRLIDVGLINVQIKIKNIKNVKTWKR